MSNNNYYTPQHLVDAIFEKVVRPVECGKWLEPAAGDSRIVNAMRSVDASGAIDAVEISRIGRSASATNWFEDDFIAWRPREAIYYDRIVTNPPYTLAEEYVSKCLDLLASGGQLILLLRLAFLEGQGRYERLWRHEAFVPARIWTLAKRPSFDGHGTDATAYGVFEWCADKRRFPELRWLEW